MKSVGGDHKAIIEKSLSSQGALIWGLTTNLSLCMPTNCSSNNMFTLEFQLLGVEFFQEMRAEWYKKLLVCIKLMAHPVQYSVLTTASAGCFRWACNNPLVWPVLQC